MRTEVIQRHAAPVPRYTSYPTANHFQPTIGADAHEAWLEALASDASLSLYVHIPFCRSLCWYCACTTKLTQREAPVLDYLDVLEAEIEDVAIRLAGSRQRVTHIHWGGGSPSLLSPRAIERLGAALDQRFQLASGAEIAVEIDPRDATPAKADAFARIGVNRISIGVQDFHQDVQKAIGRLQSFETTARTVDMVRERGIGSVNIDLVYGLPHQTVDTVTRTMEQVLALRPDRIAIFGYAHLPQRITRQRLIDETALPDAAARFRQSQKLASLATEAGYKAIGLDHFAHPGDALAAAGVQRNFQGYTTDRADALIGLGASAISRFPDGYAQNAVAVPEYTRRIRSGSLATARGIRMDGDDHMRAFVIERLMCEFAFPGAALRARFGQAAAALFETAEEIVAHDPDGLVRPVGDGFVMTERGRPLVRMICARFDAYRDPAHTLHAMAV